MAGNCGSCTACCRVYSIKELGKPAGTWCQHCAVGKGCKVYAERPKPCVEFTCAWLHSQTAEGKTISGETAGPMLPQMRPDRCKVVFSWMTDDLMSALVMPGYPDAWRKGAAREVIEVAVAQGVRVLAGLPGSKTRTLIDRYGEREIEMERDTDGYSVVPRAAKVQKGDDTMNDDEVKPDINTPLPSCPMCAMRHAILLAVCGCKGPGEAVSYLDRVLKERTDLPVAAAMTALLAFVDFKTQEEARDTPEVFLNAVLDNAEVLAKDGGFIHRLH
jgi:hypothetical protein